MKQITLRVLLGAILLNTFFDCVGQQSTLTSADTLTLSDINYLEKHSSAGYLFLADSLSKANDSINASEYLKKVDPYYLMYLNDNQTSINSYLSKFSLTTKSRLQIIDNYSKTYLEPKSEAYANLLKMYEEDQHYRTSTNNCDDSFSCAEFFRRMNRTDSIHFLYLFDFVNKNGWPTLKDGSMYASLLAIHDHKHHRYYMPILKKAVMKGDVEISALKLIIGWNLKLNYNFKTDLLKYKYYIYDVSSLLKRQLPTSLQKIQERIKKLCSYDKLHVALEFEAPTANDFWSWFDKNPASKNMILNKFMKELSPKCPKHINELWDAYYIPSASKSTSMKLYIFY